LDKTSIICFLIRPHFVAILRPTVKQECVNVKPQHTCMSRVRLTHTQHRAYMVMIYYSIMLCLTVSTMLVEVTQTLCSPDQSQDRLSINEPYVATASYVSRPNSGKWITLLHVKPVQDQQSNKNVACAETVIATAN
jgi:hypothetical protein